MKNFNRKYSKLSYGDMSPKSSYSTNFLKIKNGFNELYHKLRLEFLSKIGLFLDWIEPDISLKVFKEFNFFK